MNVTLSSIIGVYMAIKYACCYVIQYFAILLVENMLVIIPIFFFSCKLLQCCLERNKIHSNSVVQIAKGKNIQAITSETSNKSRLSIGKGLHPIPLRRLKDLFDP